MKSLVLAAVLLTACVSASLAAQCNVNGSTISPGQMVNHPEGYCAMLKCRPDGTTQYIGCAAPALSADCTDEGYENPNAPYPGCCRRIISCNGQKRIFGPTL